MPTSTIDTAAVTEQINRHIETIKASSSSYFMSLWSGRCLSNGSKSEISSLEWLKNLLMFTSGETVIDPFAGTMTPSSNIDREWFISGIDVYLGQTSAGMACLLSDYLDTLKACRNLLSHPL